MTPSFSIIVNSRGSDWRVPTWKLIFMFLRTNITCFYDEVHDFSSISNTKTILGWYAKLQNCTILHWYLKTALPFKNHNFPMSRNVLFYSTSSYHGSGHQQVLFRYHYHSSSQHFALYRPPKIETGNPETLFKISRNFSVPSLSESIDFIIPDRYRGIWNWNNIYPIELVFCTRMNSVLYASTTFWFQILSTWKFKDHRCFFIS